MAKYRVTQFGHPEKKRGCQGASLKKLLLRYGFLPDCTIRCGCGSVWEVVPSADEWGGTVVGDAMAMARKWQSRLLVCSSFSPLLITATAWHTRQHNLAVLALIASLNSVNFWLDPLPKGVRSWRRTADSCTALLYTTYILYCSCWLTGWHNYYSWLSFLLALHCMRQSSARKHHDNVSWAWWHAGFHVSLTSAGLFLAFGNTGGMTYSDDKVVSVLSVPPHNLIAEVSIGIFVLCLLKVV